jgi:phosphinothricin acetyltransferase
MSGVLVRAGTAADIPAIRDIYNHYVRETVITFDLAEVSLENRREWFAQFGSGGRHRLFVAELDGRLAGYAYSARYRPKAAYDTTVEVTVYGHPGVRRRGVGRALYGRLFAALGHEDVHRAVAVITRPNPASEGLHAAFGFREIGAITDVGFKFGAFHTTGYWEKAMDR